jgi:hypothetical protein
LRLEPPIRSTCKHFRQSIPNRSFPEFGRH